MKLWLILFVALFATTHGQSSKPPTEERAVWLAERREWIARAHENKDDQAIENLSRILRGVGRNLATASDEANSLYEESKKILISIPGHAEYFRDKVLAARRKLDEAKKTGREGDIGYYQGELQHAQQDLATLGHLPSAETVRVLGEFLYDEVGYMAPPAVVTEDTTHRAALERPNYRFAAEAFNTLSLVDKPVPTAKYPQYGPPDSVLPWRQWFEEIKNGKRTFRFEGDPTEYDLNGPATKEKLERIARDRKREQERLAGRAKPGGGRETDSEATPLAKPASIAALLGACLLVAAALFYYIRQSRKVA